MSRSADRLGHGVESDDVAVGIGHERYVAAIPNRKLIFHDMPAGFFRALCRLRAIVAYKVDNGPPAPTAAPSIFARAPAAPVPSRFMGKAHMFSRLPPDCFN